MSNDKVKNTRDRILHKAFIFLSIKPRSEYELRRRIDYYLYKYKSLSKSEKSEILESIMHELDDQDHINDELYAKELVLEKINSRKPQSKLQIRAFLARKGINSSIIDTALKEMSPDVEEEKIRTLAEKRLRTMKNGSERLMKQKLISFITKKGYPYDITRTVVDSLIDVK